jgi:hypothetical protein
MSSRADFFIVILKIADHGLVERTSGIMLKFEVRASRHCGAVL